MWPAAQVSRELLVVEVLGGTLEGGQWETCSVSRVLSVEVVKVSQWQVRKLEFLIGVWPVAALSCHCGV